MGTTTKEQPTKALVKLSRGQRIGYNMIILIIPVLVFVGLEFVLRVTNYGKDLGLFKESVNYPGYYEINADVNLRYFSKVTQTSPGNDIFLIEKPDTCFRIFVMGGSTTRGFPYQAGTAFPRILYYRLQDAFPNKRIEVVNLAAAAINSYTYIDFIDEVLEQKPDLVLLYGGHNEYYGAMGVASIERGGNHRWVKKLHLSLTKYRTYQLMQAVITKLSKSIAGSDDDEGTLMARIVKKKDILYQSDLYASGIKQFTGNLDELVGKVVKKGIPFIVSDLVANINDLAPLGSIDTEDFPAAVEVYRKAMELEQAGDAEKAKELYYTAKDLDVIRFRAPEAINEAIYEIADKHMAPVVPMKKVFENASPNGIIGDELILEHLHPNIDGYFLMADAFFETIRSNKLIDENWNDTLIKASSYYRSTWGFTELDSLIGDLNIKTIKSGWPFKETNDQFEFLKNYEPVDYVDSLAYFYRIGVEKHIEDEHIKLAQYYKKKGMPDKAFQEYNSMIKQYPYVGDLYFDASEYLIDQEKYEEALNLINSAPNMFKDFYYYFMIGRLQVKTNQLSDGVKSLEYALTIPGEKDDLMQVLKPLYSIYSLQKDSLNKARIIAEIRKLDPEFKEPVTFDLKPNQKVVKVPIMDIYNRALKMINEGKTDEALSLLLKTNKYVEHAAIKKLIGMIYFMEKKYPQALSFSRQSFIIDPNDYDNLNNYFILNLMRKDMKTAAEILNQLPTLKVTPEQIERFERLYQKREQEIQASVQSN